MRFNYLGNLTLTPSEGAILVGSICQAKVYMTAGKTAGTPFAFPAWSVRQFKAAPAAKAKSVAKAAAAPAASGGEAGMAEDAGEHEAASPARPKKRPRGTKAAGAAGAKPKGPTFEVHKASITIDLSRLKQKGTLLKNVEDCAWFNVIYLTPAPSTVGLRDVVVTRGPCAELLSKAASSDALAAIEKKKAVSDASAAAAEEASKSKGKEAKARAVVSPLSL